VQINSNRLIGQRRISNNLRLIAKARINSQFLIVRAQVNSKLLIVRAQVNSRPLIVRAQFHSRRQIDKDRLNQALITRDCMSSEIDLKSLLIECRSHSSVNLIIKLEDVLRV